MLRTPLATRALSALRSSCGGLTSSISLTTTASNTATTRRHYGNVIQTKGELFTRNTLFLRHRFRNSVSVYGNTLEDLLGGNSADGALVNRARINDINTSTRQGLAGATHDLVGIGKTYIGQTSLAHQVKLLQSTLLYTQDFFKMGKNKYLQSTSDTRVKGALRRSGAGSRKKDPTPDIDPFLPTLLAERKPNCDLTLAEIAKLRAQQRTVRSEMHARVQLLCEQSFARGYELTVNGTVKDNSYFSKKTSTSTATAGANLPVLASFFDIFRLTRLAFTLEGEIVFTPEGSMDWRSLADVAAAEKIAARKTFSDVTSNMRVGSAKAAHGPSGDGIDGFIATSNVRLSAVKGGEEELKQKMLLTSSSSSAELIATGGEEGNDNTNKALATTPPSASAKDIVEKAPKSIRADLTPSLQRTDLSNDMQELMRIALNAVEVELQGIKKEMDLILNETASEGNNNSKKKTASSATNLTPAQKQRRINRLIGTSQEHLIVIVDALFMCGRGTTVVDALLDAVEERLAGGGETTTASTVVVQHPLLLEQLIRIRQECYAPAEEVAAATAADHQ